MTHLHILHTPMHEVQRRPDGEPRWCFACRSRQPFERVVTAPDDLMSSYGPTTSIRCGHCGQEDTDL
ncbi:MAG: hypothetical protein ACR2OE_06745, partial [Thermomicrobiales bacterium]